MTRRNGIRNWLLLSCCVLLFTGCSGWQPKVEPQKTPEEALKERIIQELLKKVPNEMEQLPGQRKSPPKPDPSSVVPERQSPVMFAFREELQRIIDRSPKYVWGGSTDEAQGLDCSGYLFLAARRAGAPVRRTTAKRMAAGESGWEGPAIQRGKHQSLDIVWWSWKDKPSRPFGHVGAFWKDRNHVTHASQTVGRVMVAKVEKKLDTDMSLIKRMNW